MTPPASAGGGAVATTPDAILPVLQQLAAVMTQLVAALQAQQGAGSLTPPAPGTTPAPAGAAAAPDTPGRATSRPVSGGGTLNIATFNVLGASHTKAGSTHPKFRDAGARIGGAIEALRRSKVDVAGMQEFQGSQQADFRRKAPEFDMFGHGDNAVVWRKERFRKVDSRSLTVPYFGGKPKQMPVVQLEDRATGRRFWVVNIHNPTSNKRHPGNDGHRAEALRRERELVEQLRASGMPVYLVGDFNDKAKAEQAMSGVATASAPNSQRDRIDWVFGAGPTEFTGHRVDTSVQRAGISDHPLVVATARL